MSPLIDNLLRSGELLTFLTVAWYVIKRLNRDESLKRDYPPHRHVNGKVVYPKEFQPSRVENLQEG